MSLAETHVLSEVDFIHAPQAERREDLVETESRACRQEHLREPLYLTAAGLFPPMQP